MLIYIVWTEDCDSDSKSHILGVYDNKKSAMKRRNKHNKKCETKDPNNDIILSDNGTLLEDASTIYITDIANCTSMNVDDDLEYVYFVKIHENGSGQSYHGSSWIYVCTDIESVIEHALDYFDSEHNRNGECNNCASGKCRKEMVKSLKKNNYACIECTDYEGASIETWNKKII
jgi:hypothetical protein